LGDFTVLLRGTGLLTPALRFAGVLLVHLQAVRLDLRFAGVLLAHLQAVRLDLRFAGVLEIDANTEFNKLFNT
jgi:hypothetical protein